jgi:hypothetical protein
MNVICTIALKHLDMSRAWVVDACNHWFQAVPVCPITMMVIVMAMSLQCDEIITALDIWNLF